MRVSIAHCPFVKSLEVSDSQKRFPKKLKISQCAPVRDSTFGRLFKQTSEPHAEEISFTGCTIMAFQPVQAYRTAQLDCVLDHTRLCRAIKTLAESDVTLYAG